MLMYASVSINLEDLVLLLSGRANTGLIVLPDAFNIAEGRGPAGVCCQSVALCHFTYDRGRTVTAAVNATFLAKGRHNNILTSWGRLRKRKIKHAKPVAAVAMA